MIPRGERGGGTRARVDAMSRYSRWFDRLHRWRCCPPPPQVTGVTVVMGGGSSESVITWDPVSANADATHYRVYRHKGGGAWWLLAVADNTTLDILQPGRLGIVDAPDYWPWPITADASAERCYAVAAVSERGLEGPWSVETCGLPT